MSAEEDWWADALHAIPGLIDDPLTAPDIRARFPVPLPTLEWLKTYL